MKITIKEGAECGGVPIPSGDYMVALLADSQQINLAGKGQNYKIPAVKRRNRANAKVVTVSFYSGGGNSWSLVVTTPKHGEWLAQIEFQTERGRKKR